jgi:GTPase SAR1 family protein
MNHQELKANDRELDEGTDRLYEAKLVILGEPGAGKTSLAKKLVDAHYALSPTEKSTEGIEIVCWKFPFREGKDFVVNIWDFGGQEIYHATHQFFLTGRSLYILVADARREDTDFFIGSILLSY